MQSPIIRNGHIRNSAEILGNFKEQPVARSNLRMHYFSAWNLRNAYQSDFDHKEWVRNGAEIFGKF